MKKGHELIYEIQGFLPRMVVVNVEKDLTITEDIDWEVDKAAATFGFYAVLSEKAATRVQKFEAKYDAWKSNIKRNKEQENLADGMKKFTVDQMTAYIGSHPKNLAYQTKLIELQEQQRIIRVLAKAFEKKADLIQSKCANRRAERVFSK